MTKRGASASAIDLTVGGDVGADNVIRTKVLAHGMSAIFSTEKYMHLSRLIDQFQSRSMTSLFVTLTQI